MDHSVEPVAGVTEARHDVADLVEALVKIARRALSVQVCSYLIEIFMAYESGALSQEAPTL